LTQEFFLKSTILLLLLTLPVALFSQDYKGEIAGRVLDARTYEPIPNVHVVVQELSGVGTATDTGGAFRVHDLAVGTYSLRISAVGYTAQVVTNVVITTGRATPLTIKLDETPVEMGEVKVEANYYTRSQQMSPVSANVIGRSEVLRSPGGVQDVQRVIQNLPGVASSTDNINELIVRGGASFENLTVMDNMEIPSINHYSNQFNSAGPINMVNADMIEDVQFSAGGFPAQYGDKSSSVMNLTVREGNRDVGFSSKSGFNMAGIGTLVEGGFAGGRGSYIFSARNSLLQLVDKLIGLSSLSLTAVPKYWDMQTKVVYDLSSSNKLILNALYGDSRIDINGDPKEEDEARKGIIDSSSVQSVYPITKQYATGLALRTLWGRNGYSTITVYASGTSTNVTAVEDFAWRVRGPNGEVLEYSILNRRTNFVNLSDEGFAGAKFDLFYQIGTQHNISAGLQMRSSSKWKNDVFLEADTSRYDLNGDGTFETGPIVVPAYSFHQSVGFANANMYYCYASDKYNVTPQLALTLGGRYDHFTYSGQGVFSPRASISYQIIPQITTLTFATGIYYQTQPFPFYGDRRQIGYNKYLQDMRSVHYVLGFEHIFDLGLKMSVETYLKKYDQVAVQEEFIHSADKTFWSDRMLTVGRRTSYGVEFFLEQKQVKSYFSTISVSLSRTRDNDPRIPALESTYPSEYDYPVIATLIGGKVVKGVREWLNDAPFFLRYPSYILPLSNEMEISFRYRYQTGRPYTPKQYVAWKQVREGGVKWSKGAWIDSDNINSERYPFYSRLDLQWISRFYYSGWNINTYVAVQNVLNRKNVFFESYRSDGTKETTYQFAFFPVVGVEVEF
jgi:hypothetical protein